VGKFSYLRDMFIYPGIHYMITFG